MEDIMSLFGSKKFPPLNDPQTVELLRSATIDMQYWAVEALYSIYHKAAPEGQLWDWWIDQAAALARAGNHEIAAMAVDFARKANMDPWGNLSAKNYADLRSVEAI
jgi:hypothetical protein